MNNWDVITSVVVFPIHLFVYLHDNSNESIKSSKKSPWDHSINSYDMGRLPFQRAWCCFGNEISSIQNELFRMAVKMHLIQHLIRFLAIFIRILGFYPKWDVWMHGKNFRNAEQIWKTFVSSALNIRED